jgi:Bacterial cadherin-like domain
MININGSSLIIYANNSITFTPPPMFVGTVIYTYTMEDYLKSISNKANITIYVVDEPPVANPDNVTTDENVPIEIDVLENDYSVVRQAKIENQKTKNEKRITKNKLCVVLIFLLSFSGCTNLCG